MRTRKIRTYSWTLSIALLRQTDCFYQLTIKIKILFFSSKILSYDQKRMKRRSVLIKLFWGQRACWKWVRKMPPFDETDQNRTQRFRIWVNNPNLYILFYHRSSSIVFNLLKSSIEVIFSDKKRRVQSTRRNSITWISNSESDRSIRYNLYLFT